MRFYGGDPVRWLAEIPLGIVRACTRMMPRLRAEESVLATERIGVGTGSVGAIGTDLLKAWHRDMTIDEPTAPTKKRATRADLEAMGIKVFGPPATP